MRGREARLNGVLAIMTILFLLGCRSPQGVSASEIVGIYDGSMVDEHLELRWDGRFTHRARPTGSMRDYVVNQGSWERSGDVITLRSDPVGPQEIPPTFTPYRGYLRGSTLVFRHGDYMIPERTISPHTVADELRRRATR